MITKHKIILGSPHRMEEVADSSVQLIVTSPPFFEIEDSVSSAEDFSNYLQEIQSVFNECHRVLERGRYICVNVCDIISHEMKYPIPAHYVLLLQRAGFEYREDIIWRKPARQSFGVEKPFSQKPHSQYCFPNNLLGHILVLRKGRFDYKPLSVADKKQARMELLDARMRWNSDIWDMRSAKTPETEAPLFPQDIPDALIRLYTYEGETVLDPFLGSGIVLKAAAGLGRLSIGYEQDRSALPLIMHGSGIAPENLEIIEERRCSEWEKYC